KARVRVLCERAAGPRSVAHGRLVVKILHAIRLVVGVTRRLVLSRPELVHVNCCIFPPGLWRDLTVASLVRMCRVPLVVHYRGSLPDVMDRLSPRSRLALRGLMRMASVNIAV